MYNSSFKSQIEKAQKFTKKVVKAAKYHGFTVNAIQVTTPFLSTAVSLSKSYYMPVANESKATIQLSLISDYKLWRPLLCSI